jgi:hypothetical protein
VQIEVRSYAPVRSEIADIRLTLNAVQYTTASPSVAVTASSVESKATVQTDPYTTSLHDVATAAAMASASSSTSSGSVNSSYGTMHHLPIMRELSSSLELWTSQYAKKLDSPKLGVGHSTSSSRLKSVVMTRSVDVFNTRLDPESVESDVVSCVNSIVPNQYVGHIFCTQLKSKFEALYSSFHVSVLVDTPDMMRVIQLLHSADSWPEGMLVRLFFKPKNG